MSTRLCKKCNLTLEDDKFYSNGKMPNTCKDCYNKHRREQRANKRLAKESLIVKIEPAKTQICLLCKKDKVHDDFEIKYGKMRKHCIVCFNTIKKPYPETINKELKSEKNRFKYQSMTAEEKLARKERMQNYYANNKESINKQHSEYRQNNKDKEKLRHSKFYQNNKKAIHEYRKQYYEEHPLKKLMLKLRQRLSKYYISGKECHSLVNCDMKFLKKWFKYHFDKDNTKGMTFDNHGEYWHIDHVIPCSVYDVSIEEHKYECFRWANLRPLLAEENYDKNCKIVQSYIDEQNKRLLDFCTQENIPIIKISLPQNSQDTSIAGTPLKL